MEYLNAIDTKQFSRRVALPQQKREQKTQTNKQREMITRHKSFSVGHGLTASFHSDRSRAKRAYLALYTLLLSARLDYN
ncbi:hypothetical protein J6590_017794 [Homalodisca vitripennis]|nr:hypothetical protein J6590_017794 [Homalodisca vitripennis]